MRSLCRPAQLIKYFARKRSPVGFDHGFSVAPRYARHFSSSAYGSTLRDDQLGIFLAHRHIVSDTRARHVQPAQASAVGLDLAHLRFVQQLQAGNSIGLPAFQQPLQARDFFRAGGHDDLCRRSRPESHARGRTPPSPPLPPRTTSPSTNLACSRFRNELRRCCARSDDAPPGLLFPPAAGAAWERARQACIAVESPTIPPPITTMSKR